MTRLTLALILITSPAMACNDGGCEPPKPEPVIQQDGDSEYTSHQPTPSMPCCIRDGVVLYHAPLGLFPKRTKALCAKLSQEVPMTIPGCKAWRVK